MIVTQELIDTLIETNPGGCIAYCLREGKLELLGFSEDIANKADYSRQEMANVVSSDPFGIIFDEDKESLRSNVLECLENHKKLDCFVRLWDSKMSLIWVVCKGKYIGEIDGNPVLFATIQSITEAKNQISIINNISTGIGVFEYTRATQELKQIYFNDGFYTMLGSTRKIGAQFMGTHALEAVCKEDVPLIMDGIGYAIETEGSFRASVRIHRSEFNDNVWVQTDARLVDINDGIYTFYACFTDINTIKNISEELERTKNQLENMLDRSIYESEHDELTGLYNRKKVYAESAKLIEAHPEDVFLIVHFDIRRFRLYNSFFGEKEGDRLLIYIADMFRELYKTHKYGVFGRIEADDFFLCFPYSEQVIKKNEEYIHNKLLEYRSDFMVSGTSGIYVVDDRTLSIEAMYNRAIEAGKSCNGSILKHVAFYEKSMEDKMQREQHITSEMRRAIENNEFAVYLQPKYTTDDGKPFGAEALVRWVHPIHGIIAPNDFIPLFEKNGFIATLDKYMWEKVCRIIRKWIDKGYDATPVSVNVSRISMYSAETVPYIIGIVEKYNIPPELFNLELTESAYMDDPKDMIARIEELHNYGFKIMIDDFGTGYSSLNTLRNLSFDYLKMDKKFIDSFDVDHKSRAVLTAVIDMAEGISTPVIAEGVETEEQRAFLKKIGCEYIQGYLYAKPMPVDMYETDILGIDK